MFDFAWSEIALIAIVALVAIGPKDLPVAVRAVSRMVKKARRMAGEFQTHVDEMVREANLDEVRSQISQIRNFDFRGEVERTVDPDGSLRTTLASNPLGSNPLGPNPFAPQPLITPPPLPEQAVGAPALADRSRQADADGAPDPAKPEAPAFIPPNMVPPPAPVATAPVAEPPAFIPPQVVLQRHPGRSA
jgi:sec-independent protein translocase protein TatB